MQPEESFGKVLRAARKQRCLSQETARRELARAGIWKEAINGIPPRLYARAKTGCLQMHLIAHATCERERTKAARVAGFTDCCVPIHSPAQNGDTRRRDSHLLDTPKAPSQFDRKRQNIYTKKYRCFSTTTTPRREWQRSCRIAQWW